VVVVGGGGVPPYAWKITWCPWAAPRILPKARRLQLADASFRDKPANNSSTFRGNSCSHFSKRKKDFPSETHVTLTKLYQTRILHVGAMSIWGFGDRKLQTQTPTSPVLIRLPFQQICYILRLGLAPLRQTLGANAILHLGDCKPRNFCWDGVLEKEWASCKKETAAKTQGVWSPTYSFWRCLKVF
jgi:hypothetical protein